jgi:lipoate-protein ligase B
MAPAADPHAPAAAAACPAASAPPPAADVAAGAATSGLRWDWLGRVPYVPTWQRQLALREELLAGRAAPTILLCEHPPVITLGRSARPDNVRASPQELRAAGVAVHAIERGGDVTYHGPGQLMIYPVVRIRSVVAFLSTIGRVLADTCAHFGVAGAAFRCDPAGLWLGEEKLAACGIHLRHGVCVHGWAFNVATPPEAWRRIRPCGGDAPQLSLSGARTRGPVALPAITVLDVAAEVGPRLLAALPPVLRAR